MLMIRKEKTFENFLNDKIVNLSASAKYNIIYAHKILNGFCIEIHNQTLDEIIKEAKNESDSDEIILEVIQDWINKNSNKFQHTTLINYVSGMNRYLKYQKIRIDQKEIEWPQNIQEERYAISNDEIEKILRIASYERRGYYLALLSTGARPVEITGLRKKDFKLIGEKYMALIPAHLTKKKIARTIFFSNEVTPYIITLMRKRKNENDSVFSHSNNPSTARETEGKMFRYYCDKLKEEDSRFADRYESTGYHKINMYCFRGHFFTKIMRVVGDDTAHAMIGHGAYLQQYQRRTAEEKKELWDELESEILIFDNSKKNKEIKKLKEANTKLVDQEQELQSQAKQIKELQIQQEDQSRLLRLIEKYPRMQD
jgi:integrase